MKTKDVIKAQEIGKRVRAKREELNISQTDLANSVGLSRSTMCKIESGNNSTSLDTFKNIAKVLNVDVMYLLLGPETREEALSQEKIALIEQIKGMSDKDVAKVSAFIELLK